MNKLSKKALALLFDLVETGDFSINENILREKHADIADELIDNSFLRDTKEQDKENDLCCDDEDNQTEKSKIKFSVAWKIFIFYIAALLGTQAVLKSVYKNLIWKFGIITFGKQKIRLYFARRWNAYAEELENYFTSKRNTLPIMIITTSRIKTHYLNRNIRITSIWNIMAGSRSAKLSISILRKLWNNASINKQKNNKEGFSDNYRTAVVNGAEYKFTKTQAEIIEFLHKKNKPIHKYELMANTNSMQDNPEKLFHSRKGYHSVWNTIIKHDSCGNYWLDLT